MDKPKMSELFRAAAKAAMAKYTMAYQQVQGGVGSGQWSSGFSGPSYPTEGRERAEQVAAVLSAIADVYEQAGD